MEEKKNQHTAVIIVNATPYEWTEKEITYAQVVNLAYPDEPVSENSTFKVGYKKKNDSTLTSLVFSSKPVKVHKDMIFNVAPANRA